MRFDPADEAFMREALNEAEKALAEGEIPVGCVLVSGGGIIARAHNHTRAQGDVTAHAEMLALRAVSRYRLRGAALYVTLEPCPMCAGAIALSGLSRVIYASKDEKYGCCGSVYRLTEDPVFPTFCRADGGLLKDESDALLKQCFGQMRDK